jgi:hypothetical protein
MRLSVNNMTAFCIQPELALQLKEAARKGEITMQKLFDMSSEDRNKLFSNYSDKETATQINAGFEKAMVSNQKKVMEGWVKRTFSAQEKKSGRYIDIQDKINELDKLGVLTPEKEKAYLSDLVATKLGATVTSDEAKIISEHATKLEQLSKETSEFGTNTVEYFQAKKQLDDYLASLTPSSNLKVLTSTVGRGSMLASFKSPLLNIESNTIQGFLASVERRISGRSFQALNNDYANRYMSFINKVYDKSGYDLSRFEALGGGRKTLGEDFLHSQGTGPIRALGRVYEDVVFKKMQGAPDVMFSAFHFADSANLKSTVIAKTEGLTGTATKNRALEIFKDATRLEPKTKEGIMVRAQAVADATRATYTNKSIYSDIGLGIRKIFNIASGDFRAGDNMMPFVKTPANVLGAGLESSGVFVPIDTVYRLGKMANMVRQGEGWGSSSKEAFAGYFRSLTRAGLGITGAYIISGLIKPEDFIGAWPTTPKEQQLLSLQNAPTNSIRIGGKWVSLDYLGPLGAPLLGFLYGKKYGDKTPVDAIFQYYQGARQPLQNLPGLQQIAQTYAYLKTPPSNKDSLGDVAKEQAKNILGFISSRIIPGFVSDYAKIDDKYVRSVDKNDIFAQVQSNIPGIRQGLPIKKNLFGDEVKTEPWVLTLLFGARVKNAAEGEIIDQLVALDKEGELPAITDVSKSSTRAKALKKQIGEDKFSNAMTDFGKNLKQAFIEIIQDEEYKSATPQEKKKMLDKAKETTFNDMLDTYGYEKPEKP